jgi:hypothetical protein
MREYPDSPCKTHAFGSEGFLFDKYQWQLNDHDCEFQPDFDQKLFCERNQNAVIFFIGDSLTFEQSATLTNLLGANITAIFKTRSQFKAIPIVQNVCGDKHVTLLYRWSTFLGDDLGFLLLNETFPTTLILNTGAHYGPKLLRSIVERHNIFSSNMDKTLKHVKTWQLHCREQNLRCPFFWRTTAPGHWECDNFTEPMNNITCMEAHIAANSKSELTFDRYFGWELFQDFNEMTMTKLQ